MKGEAMEKLDVDAIAAEENRADADLIDRMRYMTADEFIEARAALSGASKIRALRDEVGNLQQRKPARREAAPAPARRRRA